MKLDWAKRTRKIWPLVFMILIPSSAAFGIEPTKDAVFQYAGGTEKIEIDCAGKLEVTLESLVFKCPGGSVVMPFSTITLMQFRPDVSRRVRKLKLKWTTYPNILIAGKQNQVFHRGLQKAGRDSRGGLASRSPFDAPLSCRDRAEIREARRGDALRGLLLKETDVAPEPASRANTPKDWSRLRNILPWSAP